MTGGTGATHALGYLVTVFPQGSQSHHWPHSGPGGSGAPSRLGPPRPQGWAHPSLSPWGHSGTLRLEPCQSTGTPPNLRGALPGGTPAVTLAQLLVMQPRGVSHPPSPPRGAAGHPPSFRQLRGRPLKEGGSAGPRVWGDTGGGGTRQRVLTVLPRLLEMLQEVAAKNPLLGAALAPRLLPGLQRQRHGGGADPPAAGSDPAHGPSGVRVPQSPGTAAAARAGAGGRQAEAAPREEVRWPRGPDAASRVRGVPLAAAGRRRPPSRPLPAPRRVETTGQGAGGTLAHAGALFRALPHVCACLCTLMLACVSL